MSLHFDKYAAKGNEIVNELARELGIPKERDTAARILRSVLHTLRSHMPLDEAFNLLAQLPMALKAVFVDGWNIHKKQERIRHIDEFVMEAMSADHPAGGHDFMNLRDGEYIVRITFHVLSNHLSQGEVADLQNMMPGELKKLWKMSISPDYSRGG